MASRILLDPDGAALMVEPGATMLWQLTPTGRLVHVAARRPVTALSRNRVVAVPVVPTRDLVPLPRRTRVVKVRVPG